MTTTTTVATTAAATTALTAPALWGGKGSFPASQAAFEAAWEAVNGLPATPANRRALAAHLRASPAAASSLAVAPGLEHDLAVFRPEGWDFSGQPRVSGPTRWVRIVAPWTGQRNVPDVFRVTIGDDGN